MNHKKYRPFTPIKKADRKWPDKTIGAAPIWCSVDLRDGNQALETPMQLEQKLLFFSELVKRGFKEIEVGFPAASDTEYKFCRALIEGGMIPDDVVIQVLTQARPHIIERTFEALAGVKRAIVHLYNSTSTLQRDVVFGMSREEIKKIATDGASLLVELSKKYGGERFRFEYSPESFTGTEIDYALEVCDAVADVIKPTPERKLIINLPSTVEMATPNVYADQIEYISDNIKNRASIEISLHAHNDRGTGVAATELALMAGADRVEGTLFGNGERTGNADILNLAMNMYSQGIDPKLDFSDIDDIVGKYEEWTGLSVHPRHPYAGSLVFTAFSGSHQDAIKKGLERLPERGGVWEVPYLPIDPKDVGRSYDPIIRFNSQSGKGGAAYILETKYGIRLPKAMQPVFGAIATEASDLGHKELDSKEIYALFEAEFINAKKPLELIRYDEKTDGDSEVICILENQGERVTLSARGNGLMDAFCRLIRDYTGRKFDIVNYSEHSMEYSSKSKAITYLQIEDRNGGSHFGCGISSNISKSSLRAVVSAVNRMIRDEGEGRI